MCYKSCIIYCISYITYYTIDFIQTVILAETASVVWLPGSRGDVNKLRLPFELGEDGGPAERMAHFGTWRLN